MGPSPDAEPKVNQTLRRYHASGGRHSTKRRAICAPPPDLNVSARIEGSSLSSSLVQYRHQVMKARLLAISLTVLLLGAAIVCYRDATSGDPASTRYAAVTRYAPVIHWGS